MKDKSDILKYVAAIVGGVLGAYLFASSSSVNSDNSALGFIVMVVCTICILGYSINSFFDARDKRHAEKVAEMERYQE